MAIAITLQEYLSDNKINYDTLPHPYTMSSLKTAQASQVPGDRIAKGVVLKEGGEFLLAVLPASNHIRFDWLQSLLGEKVDLASEEEVEALFADCELGAIPPIGKAYGLDVVIDDSLAGSGEVYFEGGDHKTLIHVEEEDFSRMMGHPLKGVFSRHD
ncbi:MAG: YbaK/EbsC family protein [Proteobacteria bacterium]|nr:YbaK/EbsC family protein [Pseudomonadota bacterium]MDA1023098.1 YbaK/EbsC family protein [Pseudomonadota bacterium]